MLSTFNKICILFFSLFFLVNFKIGHAQILLQSEIGTITSINSGTDRIVEMLREEDSQENTEEDLQKSPERNTNKTISSTNMKEVTETAESENTLPVEKRSEDIEIFFPYSTSNNENKSNYNEQNSNDEAIIQSTVQKNDEESLNKSYNYKIKRKNGKKAKTKIITSAGGALQKVDTGNGGEIKNHISGVDIAVVREIKNPSSKLFIGGVIDYNHNSYDNKFNGVAGDGKSDAFTFGILAKHLGDNGFYYEGSARLGRAKTDFQTHNFNERYVHYDESAPVYAGHARLGKIVKFDEQNSVDIYGSYTFAHQDQMKVKLSANENYNFGSIDSSRLRAGCRMTTKLHNGKFYYGLAYQYESNLKIKLRQNGNEIDTANGKGSSGLLELGYKFSTNKNKTASIDINVAGLAGHQKGVSFQAQFIKQF